MIKKLILANYRVYDNETIEFDDLHIIKGRNGIGKTTIVEAIGFALFGSALQRGKANEWIKEGQTNGAVILYIDDYIITRSNTLAVVEDLDGNVLARNRTGIVEWVENTYGLTADLYKTSFYIGQKDIGAFAALAPLERTKRVEKLLRIDRLDEYKTKAKEKAKSVQNNLSLYTSKLENSPFNEDLLHNNVVSNAKDKEAKEVATKQYEELLVKQGEYNQALTVWKVKVQLLSKFKGERHDLEALEQEFKEHLEKNASIDSYNKSVREKVTLGRNLKDVLVLEEYFNSDMKEVMNQEISLIAFNKAQLELEELNCEPIKHDMESFMATWKEKQKLYDLNVKIPENCPTCKQPWPEKSDVNLEELTAELEVFAQAYEPKRRENRAFEIEATLEVPTMTQEQISAALSTLKYKDQYLRLQELADIDDQVRVTKNFRIDIVQARKQNEIAERLKEMEDVIEPVAVDLVPLRTTIGGLNANIKESQEIINRETGYKAVQEEFSKLKDDASDLLILLKEFIKFIDMYRKAFGANVIPLLEENVSSIVSYLSEGKYDKIKINNDYGINNFDYYSGSEQDSINFALRLAIAQVSKLGSFNTMLLDEIAASFDPQRESLLMDILKQQSNQLIYITHGEL